MSETISNLWANRSVGKPPKFNTPEEMWERAISYFEWCQSNALKEQKLFNNQGEIITGEATKMRAMTQAGLCLYLNICTSTWHNYKDKPEYLEVTKAIESVMTEQKFTGAAAGLLNPNIIARDLGLHETVEHNNTSTDELLADVLAKLPD